MGSGPWYTRTLRWAQTNLVEIDPDRYDEDWWRVQWRKTRVQGVIVNAGGIVSYYPSEVPLHNRAAALGDRDLYGEIVNAAREEGLSVIARMDSNRVAPEFYRAHPDWIAVDVNGQPFRLADKYVTCINSPYYSEYLPQILREIISRSSPDGFSDNSWAGLRRANICHCRHCIEKFGAESGLDLPTVHNWSNEAYRQWIRWNYRRRTELWEFNNKVTMEAGGEDCRWMGMVSGDVLNNCERFIDLREIMARSKIVMLDHQRRNGVDGFEQNTEAGKRLHELAGWDTLIPESTPQYQLGAPAFRLSSMPKSEVRLWATSGFAGGIQPWWHHIGSSHEDRRQYMTAEPIFKWHEANEDVLFNRKPEASIAVVWSQANHDFYGAANPNVRSLEPYRGVCWALDRAGLDYIPIHADDLAEKASRFRVLVLPNLAAMSQDQIDSVTDFAEVGGAVIASSETSLFDENGDRRPDFALGELFGLRLAEGHHGNSGAGEHDIEVSERHTYLRLSPELRGGVDGPSDRTAPSEAGTRHPVLAGLEETDSLPFGGFLPIVTADEATDVLATFIPDFPIFPPETSWMRQPYTTHPAIIAREATSGARLVWFVADLDRCFARDNSAEHGLLLSNAVRWALHDAPGVEVEGGHGVVTPSAYRQGDRQVLHLNNRLLLSRVPGRQYDLVGIGPVKVRLKKPDGKRSASEATLRVRGGTVPVMDQGTEVVFELEAILDHEVAVLEWQ